MAGTKGVSRYVDRRAMRGRMTTESCAVMAQIQQSDKAIPRLHPRHPGAGRRRQDGAWAPCSNGWLARKLPPKKLVVLEAAAKAEGDQGACRRARRADQSQGQARQGRRAGDRGEAADRAGRAAAARRIESTPGDRRGFHHGRAHDRLSRKQHLPDAAVVRAMPNTPASIGRGITVAISNARAKASARASSARMACHWRRPVRSNGSRTKL